MADRWRYRLLQLEDYTVLLRDDHNRIQAKVLRPEPESDWELWAEYKQFNFPHLGTLIADCFMQDAKQEKGRKK